MERVSTERGSFKIMFTSLAEALDEGFGYWFTSEDGHKIVGNGTHAYAVANRKDLEGEY